MRKPMTAMAAVFVFTACDGNPFGEIGATNTTATTTETAEPAIPEAIASNLTKLTFNATAQSITVELSGLDSSPGTVTTFQRNTAAENGLPAGHLAYTLQEDPLDRVFTAVAKQSTDGSVRAGVVSDGGQFNRFFSGVYYERDGAFDSPADSSTPGTGQVSYAGDYVGLDNFSGPVPTLPAGTDASLQMQSAGRVTGQIFLNVNFNDSLVNGSIFNRKLLDRSNQASIVPTLILTPATIDATGRFAGDGVEATIGTTVTDIGSYAGIIGGTDGAALAGGLVITGFDPNLDNESEHGFWVLTKCGLTGEDATLCSGTAP